MPISAKLRRYTPDEWCLGEWQELLGIVLDLLYSSNLEQAKELTGLWAMEMSTAIEMFAVSSLIFASDSEWSRDNNVLDEKRFDMIRSIRGLERYAERIIEEITKAQPDDAIFH
jgi:hypothetical protein